MGESLVFFDVDTQVDFMSPAGRLYVPGAEQIVPNLRLLMNWARENSVPVISSADAHSANDPEFKIWPPHCVIGTPGQHRIPETQFPDPVVIPNIPGVFSPPAHWVGQYIIEKPSYNPQDNPNFEAILKSLGSRRAVVFGVATEYCVRANVLALCHRGFQVDVVIDAIKSIDVEGGRKVLEEMAAAGARTTTTAEVCRLVARQATPTP
ncbi:MAG: cysteine hydrolase [Acidobacteriota bacterium]|nr:cysteine hydrolase [Acidobacteriota bacterium]